MGTSAITILYRISYIILFASASIDTTSGFNLNNANIYRVKSSRPDKSARNIYMDYNPLHDYKEKLTIISSFQATIVINNWIDYLTNNQMQYDSYDTTEDTNKLPGFVLKPIYDMKLIISINSLLPNTILFAWCPMIHTYGETNVAYIISGRIVNRTLNIDRIAQSPYYNNILTLNSNRVLDELNNLVAQSPNITNICFDELHSYDSRYLLSWRKI